MLLNNAALVLALAWIVLIILFFIYLMRKYTFSDKWTEENPNPYQNETLAIPRGVMRGVLTLSILFVVLLLEVNSLSLDTQVLQKGENLQELFVPEDRFKALMTAFQMVIAFYFGSKVMHHVTKTEQRVAENKSAAVVGEAKARAMVSAAGDFDDEEANG